MITQEHSQTARDFLAASDQEFAVGDTLQGSEKLWGAEKFHTNFYHDFMQDFEIDGDRARVRDFVVRLLSLPELTSESR